MEISQSSLREASTFDAIESVGEAASSTSNAQNQFVAKVCHNGEFKRIKMPQSLLFEDLKKKVHRQNWIEKLPLDYKYYSEEEGFMITIDDQASFT